MKELTYDQMAFVIAIPPIKSHDPTKVYAKLWLDKSDQPIDMEDLRDLLLDITDDFNLLIICDPEDDSVAGAIQNYQIWIKTTVPAWTKIRDAITKERIKIAYEKMVYHANNCELRWPKTNEYPIKQSEYDTRYMEFKPSAGSLMSVKGIAQYVFLAETKDIEELIKAIYTVSQHSYTVDFRCTQPNALGMSFVYDRCKDDWMTLRIIRPDLWEIKICASEEYYHFLRVMHSAIPNILNCNFSSAMIAQSVMDSYKRCRELDKYADSDPILYPKKDESLAILFIANQILHRAERIERADKSIAHFNDVTDDKVRDFIKLMYQVWDDGKMKKKIDEYYIDKDRGDSAYRITFTIGDTDERVVFEPLQSPSTSWNIDIYSAQLVATYSFITPKLFESLVPESKQVSHPYNPEAEVIVAPKPNIPLPEVKKMNENQEEVVSRYQPTPSSELVFRNVSALVVYKIIEKIHETFKNRFGFDEWENRVYGPGCDEAGVVNRHYEIRNASTHLNIMGPRVLSVNAHYNLTLHPAIGEFAVLVQRAICEYGEIIIANLDSTADISSGVLVFKNAPGVDVKDLDDRLHGLIKDGLAITYHMESVNPDSAIMRPIMPSDMMSRRYNALFDHASAINIIGPLEFSIGRYTVIVLSKDSLFAETARVCLGHPTIEI